MITTILLILLAFFYILAGALIAIIAGFGGVKFTIKNILLIIIYPIGLWFLK